VILPDVNVLIYAFRSDSAHHAICKPWLDDVVSGDARFGISPLALSAVIRITTQQPRAFSQPTPSLKPSPTATTSSNNRFARSCSQESGTGQFLSD
jgi:predicted nucleic acid-binding protein